MSVKSPVARVVGGSFLENLAGDAKYAARMLRRSPGFAVTAIVALTLGIGANTAIFSVVNAVLLQPLSYPQPDRLVALMRSSGAGIQWAISVPKFIVYREQTKVFESIAAYDFVGPGISLTGGERPEEVKGIHASSGYFKVFGASVAQGRVYTAEEDRPGGPHLAVISNGLWRRRFGANPAVLGRTVDLSGDPYQIIGVLGPLRATHQRISGCLCKLTPTARTQDIVCVLQRE